jgi:hypothetical protein
MKESRRVDASKRTGLPKALQDSVESLSGADLSNVRAHKNSGKPPQLKAGAFAQGKHIHLAPGQENHLAHEAWHVVEQAQGRVKPTRQTKDWVPVNVESDLIREADAMGSTAMESTSKKKRRLTRK